MAKSQGPIFKVEGPKIAGREFGKEDTCLTKGCSRLPCSDAGLCFGCYAKKNSTIKKNFPKKKARKKRAKTSGDSKKKRTSRSS